MSFCFYLHVRHPSSSLDRTTSSARSTLTDLHRTWLACRSSHLLSSTSSWSSLPRVDPLSADLPRTRSRSRLSLALPLGFSVPRLPLHLSAAALHTLSPAVNPSSRTTRTIFPIPTRHLLLLAPPLPSCVCTRFLYLLREFTDQHDRLGHDERSVPRSAVNILGVDHQTSTLAIYIVLRGVWNIGTIRSIDITMTTRRPSGERQLA